MFFKYGYLTNQYLLNNVFKWSLIIIIPLRYLIYNNIVRSYEINVIL